MFFLLPNLLAPIFMAGALAIGIPILLHLIRRTPQGRQMFGSLMFLSPSPPRLTKRSRLSNIWLLLLRAAAVVLLALAFARPYFPSAANQSRQASSGRRILFLVDVSASMRRPDLWSDAKKQVESQLADISPADEVGLYLFDRQARPAFSFDQWNKADPAQRLPLLRAALAQASPGWSATRLGDCLAQAADWASENNSAATDLKQSRTIVLVTDLQTGAKAQALQGHEWPKDVTLRKLMPVAAKTPGNASLQWIQPTPEQAGATRPAGAAASAEGMLRVRVANEPDSTSEQFTLAWASAKGPLSDPPVPVYVAPGRSQIVKMPLPADGAPADRLVLTGDGCDFDNTLFVVPPQPDVLRILFVGEDAPDDVEGLCYYLKSALFETPLRKVEVLTHKRSDAAAGAVNALYSDKRLIVVARAPSDAEIVSLKNYVQAGGDLLWVGRDAETLKRVGALLGQELQVTEASGEYALLSRVDVTDPVFAPFADARFADFTKIHFWKHRQIKMDAAALAVLQARASFDNGDPYLLTANLAAPEGKGPAGTVYVMTSGWAPTESQLALSTKFVPMMEQLVRRKDAVVAGTEYAVDDPIALPPGATEIAGPDGNVTQVTAAANFTGDGQPGIYRVKAAGREVAVAVNLAPEESQTAPGVMDDLAQWGVKFTTPQSVAAAADRERILQNTELENRQKTWRWILLAVLGLLAVETALAGRLSRSAFQKRAAT